MNLYKLIRPFFFALNPEVAHTLALRSLQFAYLTGISKFFTQPNLHPINIIGLNFSHHIGLAAGFDKNGDYVDALATFGFGFIEIGTVTPKPQAGNPRPRLFRLTKQKAIINRMGFNNKGMDYVASKLKHTKYKGILGINIGKNKSTSNSNATHDYVACFKTLAPYASYITINVSSPNTQDLRYLQKRDSLTPLLQALKQEQADFQQQHQRYIPLAVKISPDLDDIELLEIANVLLEQKIDGVIATNTTLQHTGERGGLSGQPLRQISTNMIKKLYAILGEKIPIIASGGVMNAASIREKLDAGAKLVQVYTGLIYEGPGLIDDRP